MDGSWTLGMNGFFSKSEDKNIPKGTCNFWQKFRQLEAFEDQNDGPVKGGRWFFFFAFGSWVLLQNFKAPSGKTVTFFPKIATFLRDFLHFFFPCIGSEECGNATKHDFTLRDADFAELRFGTFLTEKKVAQVLHHWICSLVPIDEGRVLSKCRFNLDFLFVCWKGFWGLRSLMMASQSTPSLNVSGLVYFEGLYLLGLQVFLKKI